LRQKEELPVGVRGAWETEIPRHDLIGYMKRPETLAAANNPDSILANSLSHSPSQRNYLYTTLAGHNNHFGAHTFSLQNNIKV